MEAFFFFLLLWLLVLELEVLEEVAETPGVETWSPKTLVLTIKVEIKRIAKDFFILPPRNWPYQRMLIIHV